MDNSHIWEKRLWGDFLEPHHLGKRSSSINTPMGAS